MNILITQDAVQFIDRIGKVAPRLLTLASWQRHSATALISPQRDSAVALASWQRHSSASPRQPWLSRATRPGVDSLYALGMHARAALISTVGDGATASALRMPLVKSW